MSVRAGGRLLGPQRDVGSSPRVASLFVAVFPFRGGVPLRFGGGASWAFLVLRLLKRTLPHAVPPGYAPWK
jgi:hypothetical protein